MPILQNDFFRKYFEAIISDLKNALSRDDYKKILLLISEEGDEAYKIACFTLLGKYEREREELFEKIPLCEKDIKEIRRKDLYIVLDMMLKGLIFMP